MPNALMGLVAVAAVAAASALHAQGGEAAGPFESRTVLMVDDQDLLYRPGTERVLHSPRRHPSNPVIPATKPWEQMVAYCSVYRNPDTGRYQCWYQAYAGSVAKERTHRLVVSYAESDDGITWTKPDLGLYQFNDVTDTNIVLIGNGGTSVNYDCSVVVDPRDPDPARRYKMAYWDFAVVGGIDFPGLCVASSPDGIHWTKHPQAPLLKAAYSDVGPVPYADERDAKPLDRPLAISDVIDATYDAKREVFVIYAKTWLDGPDGRMFWKRGIVRTESKDFVNWSKPELMMAPDEHDAGQLHGGPTFLYHDVYFSLLQVLDYTGWDAGGTGNMPCELAISRDGIHWQRPFRQTPFMPVPGDASRFDAGCLWTNSSPVFLDDEIRFYYGAYAEWNAKGPEATGVGLAVLPLDRVAGLRPTEGTGQITLKPVPLAGCKQITVNADATQGSVRAEILDEDGYRMRGFAREDAVPMTGDSLSHTVQWRDHSITDLPDGGRYVLRLHLDNAEVFAVSLR